MYPLTAAIVVAMLGACCFIPGVSAEEDDKKSWGKAGYDDGFKFESGDGNFTLGIQNRVQIRFTHTDPEFGDSQGDFRIRRYKFKLAGTVYEQWKYALQVNFARRVIDTESDQLLEDAAFVYTRNPWANVWIGQYKAFFGRQFLTSSGSQQFVDRSIASARFSGRRQIGVSVSGRNEKKTFEYDAGLYNGNGPNQVADDNGSYQTVARVVWTPFGEYQLEESSFDYPKSSKLAVGASYNDNGVDPDPALALDELEFTRYGFEVAYKIRGFNAVGEYYMEDLEAVGAVQQDNDGFYVQTGYLFPNKHFEIAGRYSVVSPDTDGGPSEDLTEARVAFNWYLKKHRYKLQADLGTLDSDSDPDAEANIARVQMQFRF